MCLLIVFISDKALAQGGISWSISMSGDKILHLNEGKKYLKGDYSFIESSLLIFNKKENLALGLYCNFLVIDDGTLSFALQVPPLVENENEVLSRTIAHTSSFNWGVTIENRIPMGKLRFDYGVNTGACYTRRASYQTTYYPFDTVSAGYSSNRIRIYYDKERKKPGFFINPYFKLTYKWSEIGFFIGANSYWHNAIVTSIFETLPNTASNVITTPVTEKSILWGIGWNIGFTADLKPD